MDVLHWRTHSTSVQKVPQKRFVYTAIACALAAAGTLLTVPAADARITKIVWDMSRSQSPTYGGLSFGPVGQYEKLRGTAFGELDPNTWQNMVIVDIENAPRVNGKVQYSVDIFLLKPIDLSKGNHRVFYDFNNRGQMRLNRLGETALTNNPTTAAHAGNGFVQSMGYSVAGNGWDFGATGTDNMKISVPTAANPNGTPITGQSYEYIVFDNATTMTSTLTYPAASMDKSTAKLTVRMHLNDPATTIPSSGWDYTAAAGTAIRLTPNAPFLQSAIYEFSYIARDPVVAAVGLAASRDWVSFLRHAKTDDFGTPNPLAGDVEHVYSYSISQPSRTLNDFVYFGFNEDEDGDRVIDGILSHTGGGSGDAINYRFAQTGRTERNRQNHLYPEGVFPFAHQVLIDHLTGEVDGRDLRCEATGTCPKRFEVNTSNEYWVKAGSLLHSDTSGRDLADPRNARFYLVSGLSHGVGDITDKGSCQQYTNAVSPYPLHRALLVALDEWVSYGIPPPPSRIPRGSNRVFAVPQAGSQVGVVPQAALGWPNIPGVMYTGVITTRYVLDWGPDFKDEGIVSNYPPSIAGRPSYPIFVSKVDADGNEMAGIRMPPVEAPVATTTGWGLRAMEFGGPDGCESDGQHIPFATTRAERMDAGDPRLSLQERYRNHAGYVRAVARAAGRLQAGRYLVPMDVSAYVEEAENSSVLK